jgi:hypothetical protein
MRLWLATVLTLAVFSCGPDQGKQDSLARAKLAALSESAPGPQAATGDFSLTVYSTADPATFNPQDVFLEQFNNGYYNTSGIVYAPGYGVVRETRPLQLAPGVNRLEFDDVAAGIDPTTVAFQSLTAPAQTTVLEQNFEYDLANADKLLQKHLGREVALTVNQSGASSGSGPVEIRGKLLSALGGSYVVQTGDEKQPVAMVSMQNVSTVRLAGTDAALVSKPTLNWKVQTHQAGTHRVQVTYQTDGLTWRADYSLLISQDETTADLSAWVSLLNGSGIGYDNAQIKLVAGTVQRFESPYRAQRGYVTNSLFAGGGAGGAGGFDTGFQEKGFFEYHLYTLGRRTSLPNNSTKQIELFPPKLQVPLEKLYVYNGLSAGDRQVFYRTPGQIGDDFGIVGNKNVDIYVRFKNSQANHLGIPLPAGRIRTYKTDPADGAREFIGEDIIQHTPRDERVMARLGTAFELVGERKQTNFERGNRTVTESFEITLRNHKDAAVPVIIRELMYRGLNWEILKSSDKWEKQDYRTVHVPVEIPANGEKKVTYTVRYTW